MDSKSSELVKAPEIVWNDAIEKLIKSIGEKSLSLSWLHGRSEKRYYYLNNYLMIPAICLSTISGVGTVGFGQTLEVGYAMGAVSIIVSIITTLNSYFAFAQRSESHRLTAISYSKLYLQISIELALPRSKRTSVKLFMKMISEQIQRLNETQPQVPDAVIQEYNTHFANEPDTIAKPECVNGLVSIHVSHDETDSVVSTVAPPTPKNEIIEIPNISTVNIPNIIGKNQLLAKAQPFK
jgi:hypothetical protein